MSVNRIFSRTINLLEKILDFRAKRHNILVSNISNVDTPRYKAKDITFEDQLKKVIGDNAHLKRTNVNHLPINSENFNEIKPNIISSPSTLMREDLNTVDIDKEMTKLAENNIMYNASADIISKLLQLVKYSIEGERR